MFALKLRYTSSVGYRCLKEFLPLPEENTLRILKSPTIDSMAGLIALFEKNQIEKDVLLLLDEIYIQPEANFDGDNYLSEDDKSALYKTMLCFMVASMFKTFSYVISAVPFVNAKGINVHKAALVCLSNLVSAKFYVRAMISDDNAINVLANKYFLKSHQKDQRNYAIKNPYDNTQTLYLFYDTPHLIKSIRNNFKRSGGFSVPEFKFQHSQKNITVPAGTVAWPLLNYIHDRDLKMEGYLRAAPKVTFRVLHPERNKQSVKLALAIFHETTTSAIASKS